jgi:UDP-N-acetylmuramoyl-tripeptide--D-alanyl-D-alanine ligase
MSLALNTLGKYKIVDKKIAILGDMLELGDASVDEHIEILKLANEIADLVFIFGDEFNKAYEEFNTTKIKHYVNKEELFENLKSEISHNSAILIKGSRGMKMEEILEKIKNYRV